MRLIFIEPELKMGRRFQPAQYQVSRSDRDTHS